MKYNQKLPKEGEKQLDQYIQRIKKIKWFKINEKLEMQKQWEERFCADCGEPMVPRRNRETGEKFYGCPSYPDCTYTENTNNEE